MQARKTNQAYRIVDVHTFKPAYHSEYDEKFFLYIPLMSCEYNGGPPVLESFESTMPELDKSRNHIADIFSDQLTKTLDPEMNPRQKMKAVVSSSHLKATEISLWVTYTLAHLSTDEKLRLATSGKIILVGNDKESEDVIENILGNERNESHQNFKLFQIRLSWTENGTRKSAWSKVDKIKEGKWFTELKDSYGKNIEQYAPTQVPLLSIKNKHLLSDAAKQRIEKYSNNWVQIINHRYELARLASEINELPIDKASSLFLKDRIVKDLDTLIGYEAALQQLPTPGNMLHGIHTKLMIEFLKYAEDNREINYSSDNYLLENIEISKVKYELADNCIDPLQGEVEDVESF